jgi:Icc-related predicted phosphoesterase
MKKTRVFFATDVHGSEKVFMKFVNSGKFYGVDALILGGDLTGKMIVPIVLQEDGSHVANFMGTETVVRGEQELHQLEKNIRFTGHYSYRTSPDEKAELDAKDEKIQALFSDLMTQSVRSWVKVAEERLTGSRIKCYIMPGNDDRFEVDEAFEGSSAVVNPEGKILWLDDDHEMISTGYSNITPWKAPRDTSEEQLTERIEKMASQVQNMEKCIFNFHCPPFGSELDIAPLVDENLKYIKKTGEGFAFDHVGSKAIQQAIEKYQPLLGLHGHIHESRGVCKIGRTLCINPGSEYTEGVLRGAIVTIKDGKVDYQLTSG